MYKGWVQSYFCGRVYGLPVTNQNKSPLYIHQPSAERKDVTTFTLAL